MKTGNNFNLIIKIIVISIVLVIAFKFFVFIFPVLLVIMIGYIIYDIIRRTTVKTKENVKKTTKIKGKDIQEAEVVKEKVND